MATVPLAAQGCWMENSDASPEPGAGDFEIIADDALAFAKAATILARRKSSWFRPSLFGV